MQVLKTISTTLLLIIITGCSHYLVNDPKPNYDENYGYRYPQPNDTVEQDKIFVALLLSGGGTRAAALSYGVMDKLNSTAIKGGSHTLLQEVDVISSVSGASFTSAYYGLFGDRLFSDFKDKFLYRDIQGELLGKVLNPGNWFRLASSNFNRIDLAIELYDETVFDRKTYQNLVDNGKQPFIALNATNLTTGSQFTFTQPAFDILGSDLSTLPVARAVASSSAFPILLSPVSYNNYPTPNGFTLNEDITFGLEDGYNGRNPRRYMWAYNQSIYHNAKSEHPYLHLMDGGLSDNIGVRYLADSFKRSSGFLFRRKSKIDELVIIIANAKTGPPESLDKSETPPDLLNVAYKTATISMDNYSFESVQMVSEILNVSAKTALRILKCQAIVDERCTSGYQLPKSAHHFKVTVVEVNFLNIKNDAQRERMLALPTTFSLEKQQVAELIRVGGNLLEQSQAFNNLISRIQ